MLLFIRPPELGFLHRGVLPKFQTLLEDFLVNIISRLFLSLNFNLSSVAPPCFMLKSPPLWHLSSPLESQLLMAASPSFLWTLLCLSDDMLAYFILPSSWVGSQTYPSCSFCNEAQCIKALTMQAQGWPEFSSLEPVQKAKCDAVVHTHNLSAHSKRGKLKTGEPSRSSQTP